MITTTYHSPLGDVILAADARGLRGVWFSEDGLVPSDIADLVLDMHTGVLTGAGADPVEWVEGSDALSGGNPLHAAHPANAGAVSVLERTWAWLNAYFAGQAPLWIPPLALEGDELAHAVWVEALELGCGEACSLDTFVRRAAGRPGLVEACGVAAVCDVLRTCPIAVIVPTHRVVLDEDSAPVAYRAAQLRAFEGGEAIR